MRSRSLKRKQAEDIFSNLYERQHVFTVFKKQIIWVYFDSEMIRTHYCDSNLKLWFLKKIVKRDEKLSLEESVSLLSYEPFFRWITKILREFPAEKITCIITPELNTMLNKYLSKGQKEHSLAWPYYRFGAIGYPSKFSEEQGIWELAKECGFICPFSGVALAYKNLINGEIIPFQLFPQNRLWSNYIAVHAPALQSSEVILPEISMRRLKEHSPLRAYYFAWYCQLYVEKQEQLFYTNANEVIKEPLHAKVLLRHTLQKNFPNLKNEAYYAGEMWEKAQKVLKILNEKNLKSTWPIHFSIMLSLAALPDYILENYLHKSSVLKFVHLHDEEIYSITN